MVGLAQRWSPACTQNLGGVYISTVSQFVVKLACGTDMAETTGSPPAEAFIPIHTNVKQCLRVSRGATTDWWLGSDSRRLGHLLLLNRGKGTLRSCVIALTAECTKCPGGAPLPKDCGHLKAWVYSVPRE